MAIDARDRIREMELIPDIQGVTDAALERIQRVPEKWSDPVRAGVSYFRIPDDRMERGRITLMQNGQNATERVMYRDYQLLRRYGGYHGASHPADWQRNDVYLGIIMDGGLGEFDAEQIIDMTWHCRPGRTASDSHRHIWRSIDRLIERGASEEDAVLTIMPQLMGRDLSRHTCEKCGPERLFRDAESVRHHRAVMHKDDVQTLGTRDAIAAAIQAGGNGVEKLIEQVMAQNAMLIEMLQQQNGSAPRRGRPPKTPDDE